MCWGVRARVAKPRPHTIKRGRLIGSPQIQVPKSGTDIVPTRVQKGGAEVVVEVGSAAEVGADPDHMRFRRETSQHRSETTVSCVNDSENQSH